MSTIEQRKNEKLNNKNDNVEKQSNWGAFGVNIIYNFILTLLIGILGANVIFLSSFLINVINVNNMSYLLIYLFIYFLLRLFLVLELSCRTHPNLPFLVK